MKGFKCNCGHVPQEDSDILYCVTKASAKKGLWSVLNEQGSGGQSGVAMGRLAASLGPVNSLLFRCPSCDRIYVADGPDGWNAYRPEQS